MPASLPRTRRRRDASRRDDLLDAAQALFLERGVAGTTVADVTERAGVAKGTFYLYFDSKDHLVTALLGRLTEGMLALVEATMSRTDGEFHERTSDLTRNIVDYWIEQRALFRVLREAGGTPETAKLKSELDGRILDLLTTGIAWGIEAGLVDVPDARRAAEFIYFGCQGSTTANLLAPDDIDRDALLTASEEIVHRVLSPRG